ncbi:superoxide dismutase 1 copper chaperone-like isoform X2 [Fopius arisanus]|uniref:Superoxide dismutase 1 copper chaperone-like isoform X1 n=1 Tax=Fopius arisanus TaxID=64838 RepID=A0A9R1U215_9HYME|nr:PREDICTED: superoxide dismutase 1 copper chaperone-like isoform X1 [Fopius arisanus]XP_011305384.1 PREDICTED: superoxide dismutase 1 copper chaperone-like isoform X1 [Fopius arisanus]XP_011305385.1 PREDICTED: superoxide dismutase 1 copper chaperone-like isoform X2 [Fopius arisanus]
MELSTRQEKRSCVKKLGNWTISQIAEVVRKELDNHGIQGRVYVLLTKLRKRKEIFESEQKMVEANTEATGVLDKGNSSTSKFDGNSGQKLTCGIIARSSGVFENMKRICACDGKTLWDE